MRIIKNIVFGVALLFALLYYIVPALAIQADRFVMCNTASQVAEFLTMLDDEDMTAPDAMEAIGKDGGNKLKCGRGYWVFEPVRMHSKITTGKGDYIIHEITLMGQIINGVGMKGEPMRQFGYSIVNDTAKPTGYTI